MHGGRVRHAHDTEHTLKIASENFPVSPSDVPLESVPLARTGLTGRPRHDRPAGHAVCSIKNSIDRLRGTVRPFSRQTMTAKPYSCRRFAAERLMP